MASTTDDTFFFGEFKWRKNEVGISELEDLKRQSLLVLPSDSRKEYYLVSLSGFSSSLIEIASKNKDIHLIEGRAVFGQ